MLYISQNRRNYIHLSPLPLSLSRSLSKYRLKIDFFLSLLWQNFNKAYELDMFEHYIKVLLISEKKKK